jgi:hypothetical protein
MRKTMSVLFATIGIVVAIYLFIGAGLGIFALWGTTGMNTVNRPFLFFMFMTCWPLIVLFWFFGKGR